MAAAMSRVKLESPTEGQEGKSRGRRSSKRSRTGCLTCKFRKVKCDEAKPSCNRCRIFGIGCDGYHKPASRLSSSGKMIIPNKVSHYKVMITPSPSGILKFESEAEQRHFHTFQTETAHEIAGTFESVFWQRLVLQACHGEEFVLDAVLALSAYNTSLKISKSGWQDETCLAIAAEQAQFALRKYQNSLHVMRISLNNAPNPRKALIACLLVCSFEGLFGNTVTALSHARSGQTLVENFLAEHPHPNSEEEGITSPAPHIIEDSLLKAAVYFETQIVSFFDGRTPDDHAKMKMEGRESIARMPRIFKDLDDACAYWDLISRRNMHFVCECSAQSATTPYADDESTKRRPRGNLSETAPGSRSLRMEQTHRYQLEKDRYLDDIARWASAFGDLYTKLKRASNKRLIMGAHTLYVKSKCMEMAVGSAMDKSLSSHDKYFSHFREIVTISQQIIETKKSFSQSEFSAELGIIPALHMTARWCRQRATRRKAIALLHWYGAREGHWDSKAMAEVDGCVMRLEEEGLDTEYIPEGARIRVVSINTDEEGWATIDFVRGSPRTGECTGTKRIRWPGDFPGINTRSASVESDSNGPFYGDVEYVSYGLNDDGHSDDEVYRSGSCSSPKGFLFQKVSIK